MMCFKICGIFDTMCVFIRICILNGLAFLDKTYIQRLQQVQANFEPLKDISFKDLVLYIDIAQSTHNKLYNQ